MFKLNIFKHPQIFIQHHILFLIISKKEQDDIVNSFQNTCQATAIREKTKSETPAPSSQ